MEQPTNTQTETPTIESQTPTTPTEVEPNGLPSANTEIDTSGFEINDEIKVKFKDGKLNGRFGSINEVLDKLKEAEDFKANTIREQKANEARLNEAQLNEQKAVETQQLQQNTVMEMLPEFLKNDMTLTPEMEAKAAEVGIDIRDLKLGALEVKEKTQHAHQVVGSSEENGKMLAWAGETMTDAQKKAFDVDVMNSNVSEYAIKGLYSDYQRAMADGGEAVRLSGQYTTGGIKPYATQKELFRDKDYVESAVGRRDVAAVKMYHARKSITPDNVMFGRI